MKQSSKKLGINRSANPAVGVAEPRTQRPWKLILLGATAVGFVLILQFGGRGQPSEKRSQEKVYSSAADTFEPMAVSSRQSGLIEPAGVAKPLHLFAVKVGSTSSEGLAVLGAAEASSRTYVAGALLENGARLTELYSDHVVLVRGQQRHTLYLRQEGKVGPAARARPAGLTVGAFASAAPPAMSPAVRVSDAIRLAPAFEGDQVVGFHVYPGAKAGQMERWGLKSGDVLVSLSGQPLDSAEQVESALEDLAQGSSMQGEVRRGNERLSVTLDGATLMASAPSAQPPQFPMP
jgi:type II secretion system protein C